MGIVTKLYSGGGEVVAHSRVSPPQGSLGALGPRRRLHTQLTKVMRMPRARTNDPTVEITFGAVHPSPAW